jgi:hypothetical protein
MTQRRRWLPELDALSQAQAVPLGQGRDGGEVDVELVAGDLVDGPAQAEYTPSRLVRSS